MNEEDLHLAKAMASMDFQEPLNKKTVVSKLQEKIQGFSTMLSPAAVDEDASSGSSCSGINSEAERFTNIRFLVFYLLVGPSFLLSPVVHEFDESSTCFVYCVV
ncbi:hypothetical protein GE061_016953 [Apolygus lucorum]|uniref:Uncharacterized protein n=1 Tax=Apolygus lucorum TaxID=248454 RepID=A0A8S9XLM2_APOLU|nr:hypothetical protein GE061_016953 [Apolygus lucorum]